MPTAIVTGADSGIGRATAVALAEAGYDVGITWNTDEAGAEGTAREVEGAGRRCERAQLDLAQPDRAARVVEDLAERLGGLDVLVNNAGTGGGAPVLDLELDEWRRVLSVDLDGSFVVARTAARRMRGRGGRILNVTSVHEHVPLRGSAPYCAAKAALGALTQVMALELAPEGIAVNSVAPGEVATPMTGQEGADVQREDRPGIPLGRPADAREVAEVIRSLAEAPPYLTGTSVVVDGGMLLMAAEANRAMGSGSGASPQAAHPRAEPVGHDTATGTDPEAEYREPGYQDKSFDQAVEQDRRLAEQLAEEADDPEQAEQRFEERSVGRPARERQRQEGR